MLPKTQFSKHNPGWNGIGIPTRKVLLIRLFREPISLLLKKQGGGAFYRFLACMIDFANFGLGLSGRKVECPCCGWVGPGFLATSNSNGTTYHSRCPICDSRSRHRGLALLLPQIVKEPKGKALLFAPEKIILNVLNHIGQTYITTDLNSVDVDFPGEDIQSLSFEENKFEMIICNHVLEQVRYDQNAINECFRVLKPGGMAIFTVPGDFIRYKTHDFQAPGENGHFRLYGMDIKEKFQAPGFEVDLYDMGAIFDEEWGARQGDYAFVGKNIRAKLQPAFLHLPRSRRSPAFTMPALNTPLVNFSKLWEE